MWALLSVWLISEINPEVFVCGIIFLLPPELCVDGKPIPNLSKLMPNKYETAWVHLFFTAV